MPTYHQGISPSLVSLLTDREEELLPARLTVSMLPGRYATKVARNKDKVSARHPVNKHMLICRKCGRKGQYDLGLVVVNPALEKRGSHTGSARASAGMADQMQCTGYFRCKHCNGAGDWELPTEFEFFLMSGLLMRLAQASDERMVFGTLEMFDGFQPRWATDGESHILLRMRTEGQSAFMWNRLGNLYLSGGRPELAVVAFEQSIRLDVAQLESHMSIGDILYQIGEPEDAARHFRQALVHARKYNKLDKAKLRDMLATALQYLLELHLDRPETISFLPTREEYGDTIEMSGERVLELKEFSLDFGNRESFYPLAEVYMGMQQAAAGRGRSHASSAGRNNSRSGISTKVGRNEPCPCGSGKKYKRCCGR
ncbi:SEC-C domain-containing protein [Alicyclobacillus cycloheptanicus]|uniref:Tetratricopeptide (TPR) repeat protein n=1 Tax=Alicyclobacillus cycloheptanicus TaxID=1457 RepID=A0ABT9XMB7_9BACL|nr:SEC-C metal-binding domain-containing protein [Alicyclobacillus cycloheptanicus]MCL6446142.1 SEC-C domain-containing protein [Alicyclobacillus sp.]MDQ0191430.1 tetratricopeptide (TPR) repeat protein [Alicyclobacillus cycloheptanicus]WDM00834.1 SEC-C domain-containing protein [Alicyclobacillus cycloheptanicus]